MKKFERKLKIKLTTNKKGQVKIRELAKAFNVTEETIRRDLKELHDEGLIKKVHGGAVCLEYNVEDTLDERFYMNTKAKEIIARKAIKHVRPYSRIYIDFGSTTLAFSEELSKIDNLEIFTNSPLLAKTAFEANSSHKVYILGGLFLVQQHQNVGPITVNSIYDEFVDLAITSPVAIDTKHGIFDIDQRKTEIAKAMIKNSRKCMVLADNSKLHKKGIWKTCSLAEIDYLVCDAKNDEINEICRKYQIHYIF